MTGTHQVTSPIPGIFYRRPSPTEDVFVVVGQVVEAGATIGMIEIMKSFHPVTSSVGGEVISVSDDLTEVAPGDCVAVVRPSQRDD